MRATFVTHVSAAILALASISASVGCGDGGETGAGGAPADTSSSSTSVASSSGATTVATSVASTSQSSASSSSASSGGLSCSVPPATFAKGECDILNQDCAPGFHCTWDSLGGGDWTTVCEERAGLKDLGATCAVDDECEAGLFCVFAVCTPVCCQTNDQPCAGGNCNLNLSLDVDDVVRFCTYSKQCVPLTAEACPEGLGCHFEEPQVAVCIPGSGEEVPEGQPCEALNDCGDMQQCSQLDDHCRFICQLEENSQPPGFGGCLAGQTCRESPDVGLPGLGICSQ